MLVGIIIPAVVVETYPNQTVHGHLVYRIVILITLYFRVLYCIYNQIFIQNVHQINKQNLPHKCPDIAKDRKIEELDIYLIFTPFDSNITHFPYL